MPSQLYIKRTIISGLLIIVSLCVSIKLNAQTPTFEWVKSVPFEINNMVLDSIDNVYVSSSMYESIIYENHKIVYKNEGDVLIAKYNSLGEFQWLKHIYSNSDEFCNGMTITSNGNLVIEIVCSQYLVIDSDTINFPGGGHNALLLKLDPNGNIIWYKIPGYNTSNCFHTYLSCDDNDDNTLIVGGYYSNYPTDSVIFQDTTIIYSEEALFMAKYDNNGNFLWINNDLGWVDQISTDGFNNIYLLTELLIDSVQSYGIYKYSPNGSFLWHLPIYAYTLGKPHTWKYFDVDTKGNSYLTFQFSDSIIIADTVLVPEHIDIITLKLDNEGELIWVDVISGPKRDVSNTLFVKLNEPIITVIFQRDIIINGIKYSSDLKKSVGSLLIKYDTIGNYRFVKRIGEMRDIQPQIVCEGNGIFLSGSSYPVSYFDNILFEPGGYFLASLSYPTNNEIDEIDSDEISIYPNPTLDIINIEIPKSSSKSIIEIYNIQGELLIKEVQSESEFSIDIKYLAEGNYILKVINGNSIFAEKIVKL